MTKMILNTNIRLWIAAVLMTSAFTASAMAQEAGRSAEETAKIASEAQAALNGFTWNLDVTSTAGKKEDRKTTQDTVIFKDGKLNSSGLGEKGFGTSNYTLTVGDDGVPVFETMQRNDKESTVFWRGEVVEGKIRGVISVQEKDKPAVAFGFRGEKAGEATEIPAEKVEPQPEPVVEETPAAPVAEELPAVAEDMTQAADAVIESGETVVDDAAAEVAPVAEEVAAPAAEEPKAAKQPWWAPKKK